jgi:hypothetical protein
MGASEVVEAELREPKLPGPTDEAPSDRMGIAGPRKDLRLSIGLAVS